MAMAGCCAGGHGGLRGAGSGKMDGQAWTCVGLAASRLSGGGLDTRGRRYAEEGEIISGGALRRVPLARHFSPAHMRPYPF
jgi:hypothetical protein